jgi:protein TonB
MLGFSDTTVGVLVSVMLHAGVAAAFLGPLGDGEGPGATVVMVSIDGVEVSSSHGEESPRENPQPSAPTTPQEPQAALQAPKVQPKPPRKAPALKQPQRPTQSPVDPPANPEAGNIGGGGLLGALYSQPVMVSMPKPSYPQRARERGIEGKVGVKLWVAANGTVDRAEVVKSSGSDLLDRAAEESAREATFKPAIRGGVPAAAEKTMVVTFSLIE